MVLFPRYKSMRVLLSGLENSFPGKMSNILVITYSEIGSLNHKCLLQTGTARLLLKGLPRNKEYRSAFLCYFSNLLKSKTETNINMLI